jgi:hypothetical protein
MQVGNLVKIARCEDDNRGKLALVLEMFCPPNIWKIQIIGEDYTDIYHQARLEKVCK